MAPTLPVDVDGVEYDELRVVWLFFFSLYVRIEDVGEGWLHPPQTPLQAGEPPAHR